MTCLRLTPALALIATSLLMAPGFTGLWPAKLALAQDMFRPPPGRSCQPHKAATDVLRQQYGEVPVHWGVSQDSSEIIVVYVDSVDGSFTIVAVTTNGIACVRGAGHGWTDYPKGEPT